MGERVLRRCLNTRMDSLVDPSNDLISASMASCKRSRESAWVEFIKEMDMVLRSWLRFHDFRTSARPGAISHGNSTETATNCTEPSESVSSYLSRSFALTSFFVLNSNS
jgi:hypothetical protein